MKLKTLALLSLLAATGAHAESMTTGVGWFSTGADQTTGKVNRCGVEFRAFEVSGTPKAYNVGGVIGSVYLNRGDNGGVFGTSKMAGFIKDKKEAEPSIKPINLWWIKPQGQPAAVVSGKIIEADNKPYKIAGMSSDNTLNLFTGWLTSKPLTYYFEPTKEGGAMNFDATLKIDQADKDKLMSCLEEMMK